ncbi:MAG TPA: amidohydrolase [Vicinamibacterales bacterium]|nr:amidohydrolase [Vicinamibacterales bacterium]
MRSPLSYAAVALMAVLAGSAFAPGPDVRDAVRARIHDEYSALRAIYEQLHSHPELSFMEVNSAALIARELRALGLDVTEKVGRMGVVGVLRNGPGPTVLVRTDMDALPLKETTGVAYASTAVVKDLQGRDQPAMHACGHDVHMTSFIGAARTLVAVRERWSGTIVFVAQPAEEIVAGARAMLDDGLYTRFPKPDVALAFHDDAMLPAGKVGYREGPFMSAVSSLDILVRGVSGHGSAPHTAKDPVLLASQIVVALQAIVSREVAPGTRAVVTVGTIHGGLKRNIIPDEVKLELTLRAFDPAVMAKLVAAVRRVAAGTAQAAGVAEDRMPVVTVTEETVGVTANDPVLTRRLARVFTEWIGADRVSEVEPVNAAEDFSLYGQTPERVPSVLWRVGATAPEKFAESTRSGVPVPSNHNSGFAPVPEPTITTGVITMTAAVLELLAKK